MSWIDRTIGRIGCTAGTQGAVLCFHGIDSAPSDGTVPSMHVSSEHLESIVTGLLELGEFVPLSDLLARHLTGRSTAGLLAITADDAYVSWLEVEAMVVRLRLPITLFAVGNGIRTGEAFWWDRIDTLSVSIPPERWTQFEMECGVPSAYRFGPLASIGRARPIRQWLLAEHAGRWPAELEEPLARLEAWGQITTSQRPMTEAELRGFLARTGSEVGIHTMSHAALTGLSDQEVLGEIGDGAAALRDRFQEFVPYLAIPYGLFEPRTLSLALQAGARAALTLQGRPLHRRYSAEGGVPRICVMSGEGPGRLALKASRGEAVVNRLRGRSTGSYPDLPSAAS